MPFYKQPPCVPQMKFGAILRHLKNVKILVCLCRCNAGRMAGKWSDDQVTAFAHGSGTHVVTSEVTLLLEPLDQGKDTRDAIRLAAAARPCDTRPATCCALPLRTPETARASLRPCGYPRQRSPHQHPPTHPPCTAGEAAALCSYEYKVLALIVPTCYTVEEAEEVWTALSKFISIAVPVPRPSIERPNQAASKTDTAAVMKQAHELRQRSTAEPFRSEMQPEQDQPHRWAAA